MPKEKRKFECPECDENREIIERKEKIKMQIQERYARIQAKENRRQRLQLDNQIQIKQTLDSIKEIRTKQELIHTCSLSPGGCKGIVEYYIESLKLFYNKITYNPCLTEEKSSPPIPIPGQNYFVCNCITSYLDKSQSQLRGMNIWGCPISSQITAILLLLLIQEKITMEDILSDDNPKSKNIGIILQNFTLPEHAVFFSGTFNERQISSLFERFGNYGLLSPGVNIIGILFDMNEPGFNGIAPSHFLCVYMFDNMEDGIIIQSWVGDGVSPLTAIPFKIETLNAYIHILQTNHQREEPIDENTKIEIARFFNDPKANVENPSNVFIKDKRQYYIFVMNQDVLSSFISQTAATLGSGMDTTQRGGSTRRKRRTRRTKSSRKRTKRRTQRTTKKC